MAHIIHQRKNTRMGIHIFGDLCGHIFQKTRLWFNFHSLFFYFHSVFFCLEIDNETKMFKA